MSVKARIPLRNHQEDIRRWAREGKSDGWIASALGTSASSVQSFRSRHGIYRRDNHFPSVEGADVYEGALESEEGIGMWLDPAVVESRHWKGWATVDDVKVHVTAEHIYIVPVPDQRKVRKDLVTP